MIPTITIGGATLSLYRLINYLGYLSVFVYAYLNRRRFVAIHDSKSLFRLHNPFRRWPTLFLLIELAVLAVLTLPAMALLGEAFAIWFTEHNANFFGNIAGFLLFAPLYSLFFRVSPLKVFDLFAPAIILQLIFAKCACFCAGCCHSFEMDTFYYNLKNARREFPVQAVEMLVALALFVLFVTVQKTNTFKTGMLASYVVVGYSFTRFLTEFLRADLPNVLGPFDAYQIMSFVFCLIGIAVFAFSYHFSDWVERRYSAGTEATERIAPK